MISFQLRTWIVANLESGVQNCFSTHLGGLPCTVSGRNISEKTVVRFINHRKSWSNGFQDVAAAAESFPKRKLECRHEDEGARKKIGPLGWHNMHCFANRRRKYLNKSIKLHFKVTFMYPKCTTSFVFNLNSKQTLHSNALYWWLARFFLGEGRSALILLRLIKVDCCRT